ncbi:uncharacterized protein J4E84_004663 [Alternaria hordeiaustralica]|uniref:uncharacterized protein n=1 Tax=Alternaria hordeiaustralica TaxID=1187925 RepID=UPI0020C58940|nr:uncharacterized protein J4E84_004663 [Alternaria hordeiaustralica]KAI4688733.1 hypothetical protein J4E84_004663 [Alternaria hordeiaustralica]
MARKRNGGSHQKTNSAHNTHPKTAMTTHVQYKAKEGLQHHDQAQQQEHGRNGAREYGGRRGHGDRRSKSPGRDIQREQQSKHRDNRRSRTPPPAREIHDRPIKVQELRASATTDAAEQVSRKRKQEATEDDGLHAKKKARSGPGEMQPTTVTHGQEHVRAPAVEKSIDAGKKVPSLLDLKNMTEEDRKKLRDDKFKQKPVVPSRPAVLETVSHELKSPKTRHGVKDGCKITAPEAEPEAKALTPRTPSQNTKASSLKQFDASTKTAATILPDTSVTKGAASTPKSRQPSAGKEIHKVEDAKAGESIACGTKPKPSSTPSQPVTPPAERSKRKFVELENPEVASCKKAKASHEAIKRRNTKIKKSLDDNHLYAGQDRFPEEGVTYFDYDVYSIPLLCSHTIEHQYPFEVMNKPSNRLKRSFIDDNEVHVFGRKMLVLRQEALRLSRKKFWTSEDLGRKDASKVEPTRDIGDCDLYLYNGKVHIATERGLLLAAEYLKLIGVTDTQPVRFHGHKPAWMSQVTPKPEHRRVLESWHPIAALKEGGCISITHSSTVVVYEHGVFDIDHNTGAETRMAYGAREDDGVVGWFDYSKTCRIDWLKDPEETTTTTHDPTIIDWSTFDYSPLAARAAAQQAAQRKLTAATRGMATVYASTAPLPPITSRFASPAGRAATPGSDGEHYMPELALAAESSLQSMTHAESPGPHVSQKGGKSPPSTTKGGRVSRHDSPNSRSEQTGAESSSEIVGDDDVSQGTIDPTLPRQATDLSAVVTKETVIDPSLSPQKTSIGLDESEGYQVSSHEPIVPVTKAVRPCKTPSTVSQRYDVEVDWDDTDIHEDDEAQNQSPKQNKEDEEL